MSRHMLCFLLYVVLCCLFGQSNQHEYYLIAVPSGWYPQNPEAENDQMYFDYNQYYFGNPPCMEDDIEYTVG